MMVFVSTVFCCVDYVERVFSKCHELPRSWFDRDSRMAITIVTAIEFSGRRSSLRLWLEVLWLRSRLRLRFLLSFVTVCKSQLRSWLWLEWWLWPGRDVYFSWLWLSWLQDWLMMVITATSFFRTLMESHLSLEKKIIPLAIFVQFLHSNEIQRISPRKFEILIRKFECPNFKFPRGNLLNFIRM